MAAGVLVGVVAHDRRLRHRVVDAPVDALERRGQLVDRTMQVVDPRLQRDGEIDEVVLASAEEHELRLAHAPQSQGVNQGGE